MRAKMSDYSFKLSHRARSTCCFFSIYVCFQLLHVDGCVVKPGEKERENAREQKHNVIFDVARKKNSVEHTSHHEQRVESKISYVHIG